MTQDNQYVKALKKHTSDTCVSCVRMRKWTIINPVRLCPCVQWTRTYFFECFWRERNCMT